MRTIYKKIAGEIGVQTPKALQKGDMPFMHYHQCYEIFVLEKGRRNYILDDRLLELEPRDVVLLSPFEIHATSGREEFQRYILYFRTSYLERYFTPPAIQEILRCFDSKKIRLSNAAYVRLTRALSNLKQGEYDFLLFAEVMQILNDNRSKEANAETGTESQTMSGIIAYIAANYHQITGLDEIAEAFFISKHYLCRLFKEKTGISVMKYITAKKVQDACELLLRTDASVADVAVSSGFHSSMYFCRVFKDAMGCTPSEYRARSRRRGRRRTGRSKADALQKREGKKAKI